MESLDREVVKIVHEKGGVFDRLSVQETDEVVNVVLNALETLGIDPRSEYAEGDDDDDDFDDDVLGEDDEIEEFGDDDDDDDDDESGIRDAIGDVNAERIDRGGDV